MKYSLLAATLPFLLLEPIVPVLAQGGQGGTACGLNQQPSCNVNITGGGGSGGTSSNFGTTYPAAGTAAGFKQGSTMAPGTLTGAGALEVDVGNTGTVSVGSLPAVNIGSVNGTAISTSNLPVAINAGAVTVTTGTILSINALDFGFVAGVSARIKGNATISGTTGVTLMAGQAGLHSYITDLVCARTDTGTTDATVVMNDDNSTPYPFPPNSGAGPGINVPIVSSGTNTAITISSQASITGTCTARGYSGTWLLDDLTPDALPKEEGREHLALFDDLNAGFVTA